MTLHARSTRPVAWAVLSITSIVAAETSGTDWRESPPFNYRTQFEELAGPIESQRIANPLNNLDGGIVWSVSYELEGFLEMYLATGDRGYLSRFATLADQVLAARADRVGDRDFKDRSMKAWLNAGANTLGVPIIVPDDHGNPSISIQAVARMGNHRTDIEIVRDPASDSFSIIVGNDWRRSRIVVRFDNLLLGNVESRVNTPDCEEGWIRVKRLGSAPPISQGQRTSSVYSVFMLGHHTGQIVAPMARFAKIVGGDGELNADFGAKADDYLQAAEESLAELDDLWREEGDAGYFVYEHGIPHWRDGAPEPFNAIARAGVAMIYLHDVTGSDMYRDRIERIARLIVRERQVLKDDTWLIHYWFGIARSGWTRDDDVSSTTPCFEGWPDVENVSHFQPTLRFLIECERRGIIITTNEIERIGATFLNRIARKDSLGRASMFNLINGSDGDIEPGLYRSACYSFAQLTPWNRSVFDHCQDIYMDNYRGTGPSTVLYGWSVLARMDRESRCEERPELVLETELGKVRIALNPALAPESVERVVRLAEEGFYDNTTFHGVSADRWVEGGSPLSRDGDPHTDNKGQSPLGILPRETSTYAFDRGTVGMATHADSDSPGASCQFFVSLDRHPTYDQQYPAIGEVVSGIHIMDMISRRPLIADPSLPFRPAEPVLLRTARIDQQR